MWPGGGGGRVSIPVQTTSRSAHLLSRPETVRELDWLRWARQATEVPGISRNELKWAGINKNGQDELKWAWLIYGGLG
jgi:hypothetical protein